MLTLGMNLDFRSRKDKMIGVWRNKGVTIDDDVLVEYKELIK